MFLKERQDAIAALIAQEGRVTVSDLAERFAVSEDCIRKDLKSLEALGLAEKVYGGAVRPEAPAERVVMKRVETHVSEKRAIARRAYDLIEGGDTVFLDVSSTNHYLAELLAAGDKGCTVVSNMIDILQILAANPRIHAVGTGGTVDFELNGFVGAQTLAFLEPLRFDKAFIAALAVDPASGDVLTFDGEDAVVKRAALTRSRRSYLVADGEKFGAGGTYRFAGVDEFSGVIVEPATDRIRESLAALGAQMVE